MSMECPFSPMRVMLLPGLQLSRQWPLTHVRLQIRGAKTTLKRSRARAVRSEGPVEAAAAPGQPSASSAQSRASPPGGILAFPEAGPGAQERTSPRPVGAPRGELRAGGEGGAAAAAAAGRDRGRGGGGGGRGGAPLPGLERARSLAPPSGRSLARLSPASQPISGRGQESGSAAKRRRAGGRRRGQEREEGGGKRRPPLAGAATGRAARGRGESRNEARQREGGAAPVARPAAVLKGAVEVI